MRLFPTSRRIIHIEGDGGFIQNISALSTISHFNLNIKTFIINDGGYASIRMTQSNYFDGNYVGCDPETGLFFLSGKRFLNPSI